MICILVCLSAYYCLTSPDGTQSAQPIDTQNTRRVISVLSFGEVKNLRIGKIGEVGNWDSGYLTHTTRPNVVLCRFSVNLFLPKHGSSTLICSWKFFILILEARICIQFIVIAILFNIFEKILV